MKRLIQGRKIRVVVGAFGVLLLACGGAAALTPHATSLNDLCSAPSGPCTVTGKWAIADGLPPFDLGGRDLVLTMTAQLIGDDGATYAFVNAGAVTLAKNSVMSALAKGGPGGSISITASGSCTVAGKIQVNASLLSDPDAGPTGGPGGTVNLSCVGITLKGGATIEANGVLDMGGDIEINAGSGALALEKTPDERSASAKLKAMGGSGAGGGTVNISSGATCGTDPLVPFTVGIDASGKVFNDPFGGGPMGGDGGTVSISCGGGIALPKGSTVIAGNVTTAMAGSVTLDGGSGAITLGENVKIQNDGADAIGEGVDVITVSGGNVTLGKNSVLTSTAKGNFAGSIGITASAVCDFNGKLIAVGTVDKLAFAGGNGGNVTADCPSGLGLEKYASIDVSGAGFWDAEGGGAVPGQGGTVTLTGGSGGVIALTGAKIKAKSSGITGGQVSVTTLGNCILDFSVNADSKQLDTSGASALEDGGGGAINIGCTGIVALTKGSNLVAGSVKGAQSGGVTISAGLDTWFDAGMKIQNDGGGEMGNIDISAAGSCRLDGKFSAKGKAIDAGAVLFQCASFTMGSTGVIEATSSGGTAGEVQVDTVAGAGVGPCDVSGKITLTASALTDPVVGVSPGTGGSMLLNCGTTLKINKGATINVTGSGGDGAGMDSPGGYIELDARTPDTPSGPGIVIGGKLTAKGKGEGGSISAIGPGITLTSDGGLDATGATPAAPGPAISLLANDLATPDIAGDVTIGGSVVAKGAGTANEGGTISVQACNVTVDTKGTMSTDGATGGTNQLTAHHSLTINGKLSAKIGGTNTLVYRDAASIVPNSATQIVPASTPTQNLALSACP